MPLTSCTLVHKEAKPSENEKNVLDWVFKLKDRF